MSVFWPSPSQLFAPFVVCVDYRNIWRTRAGTFKQAAFGSKVIVEVFVEVDVVAGQIGENGGGEMATPQTVHGQRVGTRFQHRIGAPASRISAKKLCKSRDSGVVFGAG